jgi:hypothetical protein
MLGKLGIFGRKREGVTGGWRILHNEELHNFHLLSNITSIIKSSEIGGTYSMHGRNMNAKFR